MTKAVIAMKRTPALLLVCAAALAISGCAETKRLLGQTKRSPDEFAVYSRAPLSLPPEFTLRVPQPGADRPQVSSTRDDAMKALGSNVKSPVATPAPQGASTGEQALLQQTGAATANPNIRAEVNRETSLLAAADTNLADKILFWRKPEEPGTVVDAAKEAQRIQENQALGKPITTGETPIIERRNKAILEGIFK